MLQKWLPWHPWTKCFGNCAVDYFCHVVPSTKVMDTGTRRVHLWPTDPLIFSCTCVCSIAFHKATGISKSRYYEIRGQFLQGCFTVESPARTRFTCNLKRNGYAVANALCRRKWWQCAEDLVTKLPHQVTGVPAVPARILWNMLLHPRVYIFPTMGSSGLSSCHNSNGISLEFFKVDQSTELLVQKKVRDWPHNTLTL